MNDDGIGASHFDHVAVYVTDLERARAFYAGVLGLTEVPRPASFDFPGAWYQVGAATLHLLAEREREPASPRHFCLWVADVHAAARRLGSAGWAVEWVTKHKIIGVDRFFTRDPDGNRIEIQGREAASTVTAGE